MSPLVSVIIPTYNRAHLIGETIQSVISQTFTDWEIIVVDDGSEDNTKDVIDQFLDPRISYRSVVHCGKLGLVRNQGIIAARGEYIAFLDSDDLWNSTKLDYQLTLLKSHPGAAFVFGNGDQFGERATPTTPHENIFVGNIFLPFLLEKRFIFYVPTLLFKKGVLKEINLMDDGFTYSSDIDFFLRLSYSFEGIFCNQSTIKVRKHDRNHSDEAEMLAYNEYLEMIKRLHRERKLSNGAFTKIASEYHYMIGLKCRQHGNSKKAVKAFLNCIKIQPLSWKGWLRILQSLLT